MSYKKDNPLSFDMTMHDEVADSLKDLKKAYESLADNAVTNFKAKSDKINKLSLRQINDKSKQMSDDWLKRKLEAMFKYPTKSKQIMWCGVSAIKDAQDLEERRRIKAEIMGVLYEQTSEFNLQMNRLRLLEVPDQKDLEKLVQNGKTDLYNITKITFKDKLPYIKVEVKNGKADKMTQKEKKKKKWR